ncbi:unnamed protein product [Caenorhabditis sp. 36 PRJEB53466]|nr:unnamed protein product [Caenorhabditis sp. 36 PRJEB53466]
MEMTSTTPPTFTVQRLDAPIERIEIRLIDDNTTHSVVPGTVESREEHTTTTELPLPLPTVNEMYKKVEYVVQPTASEPTSSSSSSAEPIVIGEDPSYFSTVSSSSSSSSSEKQASAEAKAWISVSTSIPKFEGDIDEDDLPPPPVSADSENEEPEEECLANREKLSAEVIKRLEAETSTYYRLVRQRNEQQKEYCAGEAATDTASDMYRRCSNWRAEKLVYYYKLMRKTYCQVDNWPNSPKIKKTYGEYLNLFGTFYAFQK